MSKRITIIGFFLFFISVAKSQEKLNFEEVDKHSYELFLEKKWPELIRFSAEAREQGIDFFYLQVRTGIAWYNQEKYRNATEWFLKAYSIDHSQEWLQEYVYYSLIFSGRELEANKYAPLFSDAEKKKIGFKEKGLTRMAYETGYSFNSGFDELKARGFSTEVNLGADYGEGYFLKNYNFHSFDLSHRVSPNFTLNHNITYIGVNREAIVDWGGQSNSEIRINQFNYYINPVWIIGKKLNISPSLNLIFGAGDVYAGKLNNNSEKTYSLSKTSYSDAVISTAAWSDFGNFSPGIEMNAAKINDSKFVQLSSWVTWYPMSNTKLYFAPRVYFKSDIDAGNFGYNAIELSGGAQVGQFHINGQYVLGQMENFVESDGYVISNFPGKSNHKIMGSIYFPQGKKYKFVFRYINQDMTEKYQVYTSGIKSNSLEYNYIKNTITGGISWIF